MKIVRRTKTKLACLFMLGVLASAHATTVEISRTFREPRYSIGHTGILRVQPIDHASWIWGRGINPGYAYCKFKCEFTVDEKAEPLVLDVTADDFFRLTLDGQLVGRGPIRGAVDNWLYQTYRIEKLKPGKHVLEAVVWSVGGDAVPLATMTKRGGFILKADGEYDKQLTTGKGKWLVGQLPGIQPTTTEGGAWGVGYYFDSKGTGLYAQEPKEYKEAYAFAVGAPDNRCGCYRGRAQNWLLFPADMPDMMMTRVTPGAFRAATTEINHHGDDTVKKKFQWAYHKYSEAETKSKWVGAFNDLLKKGKAVTIPPKTNLQLAWHLGQYICAYPELTTTGGKGARISWAWQESTRESIKKGGRPKKDRNEIIGKNLGGVGDVFHLTGTNGVFSTPWWRCGLWCRLDIETKDEPVTITSLALTETRYPMEMEGAFSSPQDKSLADIRRICLRAMQMCAHDMTFDCPYFEQQCYPGDSRVQLKVMGAIMRDDCLIRRVMEIFDYGAGKDGLVPMNYLNHKGYQESLTYTLCYLMMYGDYVMNHDNVAWLKARLPGLRKSMSGVELFENADGLLVKPAGWLFMDWTPGWHNGTAPGSCSKDGLSSPINLLWLLAQQSAARTEAALGNDHMAAYWNAKAEKLKASIIKTFWSEKRGLLADNPEKTAFSEHAQSLALIADMLPKDKAEQVAKGLVEDQKLARCTVYFSYYLFEAYFKIGRPDLFLNRLDLWRSYLKLNITTLVEDTNTEGRSDCHAWGAHPIWFMQTGLAGIQSAAPFYAKVRIAPQPGNLKEIKVKHPHPKGFITAELKFDGNTATGTINTPVEGTFEYGGKTIPLKAGTNKIK